MALFMYDEKRLLFDTDLSSKYVRGASEDKIQWSKLLHNDFPMEWDLQENNKYVVNM